MVSVSTKHVCGQGPLHQQGRVPRESARPAAVYRVHHRHVVDESIATVVAAAAAAAAVAVLDHGTGAIAATTTETLAAHRAHQHRAAAPHATMPPWQMA